MTTKTKRIIKKWFLERAKEKTTWIGLFTILGSLGLFTMEESVMMYYTSAITALVGLFSIIWQEKPSKKHKKHIKPKKVTVDTSDDPIEIKLDEELH